MRCATDSPACSAGSIRTFPEEGFRDTGTVLAALEARARQIRRSRPEILAIGYFGFYAMTVTGREATSMFSWF